MLVSHDPYFYRLDVSVDPKDLKKWLIGTSRGATDLAIVFAGKPGRNHGVKDQHWSLFCGPKTDTVFVASGPGETVVFDAEDEFNERRRMIR